MRIWIELGDLLAYGQLGLRPTGIQRLAMELARALHDLDPGRIRFARLDVAKRRLVPVPTGEARDLFDGLSSPAASRLRIHRLEASSHPVAMAPPRAGVARRAWRRLPESLRGPWREAIFAQGAVFRHFARALAALPAVMAARRRPGEASPVGTLESPSSDDTLLTLGAAWADAGYPAAVSALRATLGLRHALLVYDVIPAVLPECFEERLVRDFLAFMRATLPEADVLLAISQATARDILSWAAREGLALRATPEVVPLGAGLRHEVAPAALPEELAEGGHVLFVSTIEPRKNHALAFRAWRRLLEELPRERVPRLVFAGRPGWLVGDLLLQFRASRFLDGKLVLVEGADDAMLAALHAGARFTIFPSLMEGWGLPVSESLGFGKVCIASRAPAILEAGGRFCLYHDPDCVSEAVALYRRAIEEPALIAAMEERIRREWRPTPWSATARAAMDALLARRDAGHALRAPLAAGLDVGGDP